MSGTRALQVPQLTTAERDALVSPKNGMEIYNTDLSIMQYTTDGGATWESVATSETVDLQEAYDNGDGTITLANSKPVALNANIATALSGMDYYTAASPTVISRINFYGDNDAVAKVRYAYIQTDVTDNTAGAEDGRMAFRLTENGADTAYLTLEASTSSINLNKGLQCSGNDIFNAARVACDTLGVGLSNPSGTVASFFLTDQYLVQFEDDDNRIDFQNRTPSTVNGQTLYTFRYADGLTEVQYAEIRAVAETAAASPNQEGSLELAVFTGSAMTDYLKLNGATQEAVIASGVTLRADFLQSNDATALAISTPAPASDVDGTNITISTPNGVGPTSSDAGSISLTAGDAAAAGNAGNITVTAGSTSGSGNPGDLSLSAGQKDEAVSGTASLLGGPGSGAAGTGGLAELKGGAASGAGDGGGAQILGGAGGNNGGAVTLTGGAVGNTANGGAVSIAGGACGNTASAGDVTIVGGAGGTNANGGDLFLRGGTVTSGTAGKVKFDQGEVEMTNLNASEFVATDASKNLVSVQLPGATIGYTEVTGTSANMVANNMYTANNAALVTLTLPTTAAVGTTIKVNGLGAGGWLIAQNASQVINVGNTPTTTGAGGSVASTNRYDNITIVCVVANTTWVAQASYGNLTIV